MNKKLKPYDNLKKTRQEWLGTIPAHWRKAKSKRLFNEVSIKNHPNEELLSATQNMGVVPRSKLNTRVVMPSGNLETFKLVQPGDFVISLRSFQGGLEYSNYRGIVSPAYNILEEKTNQNKMFYKYLFKCHDFIGELQKNVTGIRQGKNIDVNDFKEIILPIPPIEEQDQIATYLESQLTRINKFIQTKKKLISALKELKRAIINKAVTKGIKSNVKMKSSDIVWLGDIPENWDCHKFSRVAKVKSNLVHPNEYPSYTQVSPENIEKNSGRLLECKTVNESGIISANHLFYKGQILYSKVRPKLNKVVIVPFDGLCSADMYPIETDLINKYLLYFMLSDIFLMQLSVSNNRVKMPKINKEELANIIVVVPPEESQIEIVHYIEDKWEMIDFSISTLEKEISLIAEYRTRLISDVVTGKVDIRGIEVSDTGVESLDLEESINEEFTDKEVMDSEECEA